MKYGNIKAGIPDFEKEKFAINDMVEKGVLEPAEANKKIDKMNKSGLQWIVLSNDQRRIQGKYVTRKQRRKAMQEYMEQQRKLAEQTKVETPTNAEDMLADMKANTEAIQNAVPEAFDGATITSTIIEEAKEFSNPFTSVM